MLVAEEITDRLQREMVNDEDVHPLVRMVNRIHVVEEARHVRFAREEVAAADGDARTCSAKVLSNVVSAAVAAGRGLGDDQPAGLPGGRPRPRRGGSRPRGTTRTTHETRRWMGEKIMAFLDEQGMVTWYSKPIYELVSLI